MPTLAIIDMQPGFVGDRLADLRAPVLRELDHAMRNNWPIVVVEYVPRRFKPGITCHFIRKALRNYPHKSRIQKYQDDGSQEVDEALDDLTTSRKVRMVGVLTDLCVKKTAAGLTRLGYRVEVVADACWSPSHEKGLQALRRFRSVQILRFKRPSTQDLA